MPTTTVKLVKMRLKGRLCTSGSRLARMSQICLSVAVILASVFSSLAVQSAPAPPIQARITVSAPESAELRIELELPSAAERLSFRNSYGDVLSLGDRVTRIEASNEDGTAVALQKLAPGEFQAANKFTRVSYYLRIAQPARPGHMSRISWLTREQGLLMLADLLPQISLDKNRTSVQVVFQVPPGWSIAAGVKAQGTQGPQQYLTDDPDKAVFLIGPSLRQRSRQIGSTEFSLVTSGKWPFSEDDALKISQKLIEEYARVTGYELRTRSTLMLIPFSGKVGPEQWAAETRGNNVVLLLGNNASRKRVLARLALVLSHELFHLWVPNSLALDGDYDWFFEGFTLYQALRTDFRLKWIDFDDYLETIARVNESYLRSRPEHELSLIAASERRWTSPSSLVYDKGMLAAFVYDLFLRKLTNCSETSEDVYGHLFRVRSTGQLNANETIIDVLGRHAELEHFTREYVKGVDRIDLQSAIQPYGLQVRRENQKVTLAPAKDLSNDQKRLLKCLRARK